MAGCASNPSPTPASRASTPTPIVNQVAEGFSEQELKQGLQSLLAQTASAEGIPLGSLEAAFADTKTLSQVRKLVLPGPPGFKKNWLAYRKRFIEPVRIKAGRAFLEQNRSYLDRVEQETGVPGTVITAIIGVETIYGRHMGNFKVKDVLATLAFHYPDTPNRASRERLFQDQLKQLILLCWSQAGGSLPATPQSPAPSTTQFSACLNQSSSYAGAIGLPQFMPGSIRSFAIDGDGDGLIDLRQSRQDAIASVARFLRMHGWQPGMPIYFPIEERATQSQAIEGLADGIPQAKHTVAELIALGILSRERGDLQAGGVAPDSKALIVDLPIVSANGDEQVRYVVGLENFLSIVQYNRSYFYAQSVAEFAQELGYDNRSAVPVIKTASESSPNKVKTAANTKSNPKTKAKDKAKPKVKPTP